LAKAALDLCGQYADHKTGMFTEDMSAIIWNVISSWEVLGVTIVLILYLSFVRYVARSYRRPRFVSKSRPKRSRKAVMDSGPSEASDSADTNKALGLEEE